MNPQFFSCPEVFFGPSPLSVLAGYENCRAGIVTDAYMVSSGRVAELCRWLPDSADVVIFGEVTPDPDTALLRKGTSRFGSQPPDLLVALGGGSSLDAAKGIRVTLASLFPDHTVELVSVPTTSGSGSEVTAYAVISDPQQGRKYPLVSQDLVSDRVILDTSLVMTVPLRIAAETGMDVLTHAVEALVSRRASDFSDALAEKAMKLVWQYLPQILLDEKAALPREKMHYASCMAGMAFNSAGLGLVHGLAHAIGGLLHLPHGRINAMLLPWIIEYNLETASAEIAGRYAECAAAAGLGSADQLSGQVRRLNTALSIPATLTENGCAPEQVNQLRRLITEAALSDACTADNPRTPTPRDIDNLISCILG